MQDKRTIGKDILEEKIKQRVFSYVIIQRRI